MSALPPTTAPIPGINAWIDTHCHLDAAEFAGAGLAEARAAAAQGVAAIVIPAVQAANFAAVAGLARQRPDCHYALGIHPMYVAAAHESDLQTLRDALAQQASDPRLIAVGEIGLDYFVRELQQSPLREKQEFFYVEQLKIAREFGLPVLLHVRRAQDRILKQLRRIPVVGGIAHAFNGSAQQAQAFIDLGFKLGFGGAMTYPRALQIRRLALSLPLSAIVLETDAPDMAPEWLHGRVNRPAELPRIGALLAELRGLSTAQIAAQTCANALAALPRMALS